MPYVTCSCGVRLLYLTTQDGPVEHWSKRDIEECAENKGRELNEDLIKCPRIARLILEDFAERRAQLARLKGPRRPGQHSGE
jgi:hypothetical protein